MDKELEEEGQWERNNINLFEKMSCEYASLMI